MQAYTEFDCDLCGSNDAAEIEAARHYHGQGPLHVCRNCGLVYVRRRRSAAEIARSWSDEIFADAFEDGATYSARIPAVKARQVFVADLLDTQLGLRGKTVADVGAGEGQFLDIVRTAEYGAVPFALEASARLCRSMGERGIETFQGAVEEWPERGGGRVFDIATVMWTLECCQSARRLLEITYDLVADGGHVAVATGSRILVPFKKPLQNFFSAQPMDLHPFHFSANTLAAMLARTGFQPVHVNRYWDQDVLCIVARKTDRSQPLPWQGDDYRAVQDFFDRWHRENAHHQRFPVPAGC